MVEASHDEVGTWQASHHAGRRSDKVHIDGYNELPRLTRAGPGARREMFYFTDDGDLAAMRVNQWKSHFMVQEARGLGVWERPFTTLRFEQIYNLRSDPSSAPRSLSTAGAGALLGTFMTTQRQRYPLTRR